MNEKAKRGKNSEGFEFDEIGYWSEIKLDIIREYAVPYSEILTSNRFEHFYVDAFCGAGVHKSKSTNDFVAGSPLNALLVTPPFKHYHFIDLNEKKNQFLERIDWPEERCDYIRR